ncbi:diacylglycerol kinase [Peptoniphilus equinus]|uniref:Diacylglycerol kinase n=1 Tax=Peptoniphilus equinus TaxID=3016343 RepID=A0ABY7QUB6_9FIRM|nr:diacylglycerol kinase [Peptoniphilus equinus]WBW50377.1 diacylglycerol kinase [Peptoniphilus equinus]
MKKGGFIASFNYAVQGIVSALKTERNLKFHYLAAVGTIFFSLFMDFTRTEFIVLVMAIIFVVVCEMFNTAIERCVDMIVQDYDPIAKYVKDVSAGAVMLSAITAVIVGYLLFYRKVADWTESGIVRIVNSDVHLAFVAVLLVLILTVGGKYLRAQINGGTYFQGGAISGHSALAFAAATIIALITVNALVTFAAFLIALLVAESRVEGKIHTIWEVISGAVLGISVALIVFKVVG